jgi:HD-GYP domain-containing protein (c-di-GMP phosphodiesterase class II)
MIKKVNVKYLKPGMFIHNINCGWLQHPFLKSSIKIKDGTTIKKITEHGIREVYIDTDKGPDIDYVTARQELDSEIQKELDKIAGSQYSSVRREPLEKEIIRARVIKQEAKQTVGDIMEEVRFGRPIKTEKVEKVVDKMVESILRNQDALITLGRIKKADEYTYMHSLSVCVLMISFGNHLGFDSQQLKEVGIGAMLHDVGKMQVPEEILNSKGALSDEEYELMKKHVEYSHLYLENTEGIAELSVTVASQHHERMDGKGYPNCLKGDDISIYGQAAAISDVYDAMTSERCYQHRYEPTEVLKKLYEWNDSYNKDLVQQFIRCVGIYPVGSLVRLESGLLGVVIDQGKENLLQPNVRIIYDTRTARHVVPPYDFDLSKGGKDMVSSYELADKWNIKPELYL